MGLNSRAIELNEAGWWAHWGKIRWVGKGCYVLGSQDTNEPFFNRAGLLTCGTTDEDLQLVEAEFHKGKRVPCIVVREDCSRSTSKLRGRGYNDIDRMVVMAAGSGAIQRSAQILVRRAEPHEADRWCEVYLKSFYGDLALKPQTLRIVSRISAAKDVILLFAEYGGEIVGVTALYRSPGLLGLYCLGTLPRFRGKGGARSILSAAQSIATAEKRTLVLQSLLSEETHPFYSRFGFRKLYVKRLLQRMAITHVPAHGGRGLAIPDVLIRREPGVGPHLFASVFQGFERVSAVEGIFGKDTERVLSELPMDVVDEEGYMHINAVKGSVVVSASYLREGDLSYLYLDAVHELVHIRQHMEGKELWDRSYKYVDRPTELEAYRTAVAEARRIGFDEQKLVDYLKVEWVSEEDFARFLETLGVKRPPR